MIYLTRIQTDAVEAAKHHLGDSYRWHQMLWKAFPSRDEQPRDFLSRVDFTEQQITAWLLSPIKPKKLSWGHWETKEVSAPFLKHKQYFFSLRVNPTIKRVVRFEDGTRKKNGQRTSIYGVEELKNWLVEQKAPACGFTVEECRCEPPVKETFVKDGKAGSHSRVDFQGILTVVDRKKFIETYQDGIGAAKAFGFGMLLLKPLQ